MVKRCGLSSLNGRVACSGVLKPAASLPMLHVTLPVDLLGPSATLGKYNLIDDIALRNGTRS